MADHHLTARLPSLARQAKDLHPDNWPSDWTPIEGIAVMLIKDRTQSLHAMGVTVLEALDWLSGQITPHELLEIQRKDRHE